MDPCMGSGHILVYAFDVFMQLYLDQGYDEKDAIESILTNNLYGLDIDDRAFQLAYFALYMKACEIAGRRILKKRIKLNICAIQESNGMEEWNENGQIKLGEDYIREVNTLIEHFINAKEYGSLISCFNEDYEAVLNRLFEVQLQGSENILLAGWIQNVVGRMPALVKQAEILSAKYDVVTTNPPYLGGGIGSKLSDYLKKFYPNGKMDLFAAFIERCSDFAKDYGYQAMITQQSWMFLTSYEKIRAELHNKNIVNMIHLGARAFDDIGGEIVQTTAFILTSVRQIKYVGTYMRLTEGSSSEAKRQALLKGSQKYYSRQKNFMNIPGCPIAYWFNIYSAVKSTVFRRYHF